MAQAPPAEVPAKKTRRANKLISELRQEIEAELKHFPEWPEEARKALQSGKIRLRAGTGRLQVQTRALIAKAKLSAPKLPSLRLPKFSVPKRADTPKVQLSAKRPPRPSGKTLPIGLDIGTTAIKWAQFAQRDGKARLVRLGLEPITIAPTVPEALRLGEMKEQLKRVVSSQGLSGPVALSLPVDEARFRLVKMPVLPPDEMKDALRWQVEQSLPAGTTFQDVIADYIALPGLGAAAPEPRVLIVTVSRAKVAGIMDCVRGTGLNPVAVEVDPAAIQSCLSAQGRTSPQETTLLLHLGAANASFSIFVGGYLAFSRPILTMGKSLTQTISEQLRVAPAEAETLKRTFGLLRAPGVPASTPPAEDPTGRAAAVSQSLASPMENLMVDLLTAFKGFSHQMTQSQIQRFDRVFLDGGGAALPGLLPWLQLRMGAPVEIINPLAGFELDPAVSQERSWAEAASHLSVAVGLAARDLADSKP